MSWQITQVALVSKWAQFTAAGGSNIIHFRRVLRGELVQRIALGFFDQISTDLTPDLLEASATPALEVAAEMEALTFDRQQDIIEGNFFRAPREDIAALAAAAAGDEAMRAEFAQNLREKISGHRFRLGEVIDLRERSRAMQAGEFGHDATGVINLNRNLH